MNYTAGIGSLEKIDEILGFYQPRKTLLVTGRTSYAACGAADILAPLFDSYDMVRFSKFDANPKIEDAIRGTKLAQEVNADMILAVGGGSVVDMAKLINAFLTAPDEVEALVRGDIQMSGPGVNFLAVPTTAGPGSEATHFAVVYIGHEKFSLASPYLLPTATVLDGRLVSSCPPYQQACNGLDGLAQAIESAWSASATDESLAYSFEAIEKLMRYLPIAVAGNADEQVYQELLFATNLAGRAINVSKTTAAHAWSYGFTSYHDIPHGHAVWLTLPEIVGMHGLAAASGQGVSHPRGASFLSDAMDRLLPLLGVESAIDAPRDLREFMRRIGVEPMMELCGAESTSQRQFLSEQVNAQRMSNNPVALNELQITKIFRL